MRVGFSQDLCKAMRCVYEEMMSSPYETKGFRRNFRLFKVVAKGGVGVDPVGLPISTLVAGEASSRRNFAPSRKRPMLRAEGDAGSAAVDLQLAKLHAEYSGRALSMLVLELKFGYLRAFQ